MAERKELLAMATLLGQDENSLLNKTDLELLELIIKQIKDQNLSLKLNDSLAIPQSSRDKINLIEANRLWTELDKFNDQLRQDYTCRRQMLLTRLDCTIESFKWKGSSNSAQGGDSQQQAQSCNDVKSLNDRIHECYDRARIRLKDEPQVTIARLLATREIECDKLLNEVISSSMVDCKIAYKDNKDRSDKKSVNDNFVNLKQVIIPHVPDRGGRTDEHRQPQKETFGKQRQGGPRSRDGGSHQRDRDRRRR